MTDNQPDDTSPAPDPVRPSSPFAEWTHLSQPDPAPALPPPTAQPPQIQPPQIQPPQIRPPFQPGPPSPYQNPAADWAFHRPPVGYPAHAFPPPLFPPAPPGLYPTPDDPLVSEDFTGWWNRSFRLLTAVWRQAALVQLLWLGPVVLSGTLVSLFVGRTFTELTRTPANVQPDWHPFLRSLYYLVPLGLLTGLLWLLATLTTLHLVVQAAVGRPLSVRYALRTAGPRVPAYIGWGLLSGLVTLAGSVCCILPGYYVASVFLILPTVVLLERGRVVSRCFRLFHAKPGAALARVATIVGLGIAAGIVQQVFFSIVSAQLGPFGTDEIAWGTYFAVTTIAVVLYAATQVVLAPMYVTSYADMRARHEPFSTAYLTEARI